MQTIGITPLDILAIILVSIILLGVAWRRRSVLLARPRLRDLATCAGVVAVMAATEGQPRHLQLLIIAGVFALLAAWAARTGGPWYRVFTRTRTPYFLGLALIFAAGALSARYLRLDGGPPVLGLLLLGVAISPVLGVYLLARRAAARALPAPVAPSEPQRAADEAGEPQEPLGEPAPARRSWWRRMLGG